jgi:hypothetical protein
MRDQPLVIIGLTLLAWGFPACVLIGFQKTYWRGTRMAWLRFILIYVFSIATGILADKVLEREELPFKTDEDFMRRDVTSVFIVALSSVLFCLLFTILLALKRHEPSLLRRAVVALGGVIATAIIAATCREPEWQIAAKDCMFGQYFDVCTEYDQYDSVLACWGQKNVGDWTPRNAARKIKVIREAGRQKVDAFMDNYKPKECK